MKMKITIFLATFVLFLTPALASATSVSGSILTDTVWTKSESPYIVGYTRIPSGITLTIEEGTVVKFSNTRATIEVSGTLTVNGTEATPIYFTSINDNSVGGATGTDAPALTDWGNIMVKEGGVADINHAIIRYGGFTGWLTETASSNLYNRGGTLTVSHSTINSSLSGITHDSGTTTLENNIISDNSQGIVSTGTGNISLTQNIFSNNAGSAAYLDLSAGIAFTHSGNTATGGNGAGFYLRGTANSDYILEKDTMPYIIGYLEIPLGKTVTAHPGTVFKFEGNAMRVSGKWNAEGTVSDPIYFTSLKDDAILGDTNGDGETTRPTANDWSGILVLQGGEANFDHSIIRYGGFSGWNIFTNSSNISNAGGTLNITHSEISRGNTGVSHSSGMTTLSGNTLKENSVGLQAGGQGSLAFTNNVFSDNANSATYFDISGGFTFSNFGNTALGTGDRGIAIRGTANTDQILAKDGMPYLVSYISVPAGRTLAVSPGAVIKMSNIGARISVEGTLDAAGTEAAPIYFTSINDNTIGGATGTGAPNPADWAEIDILSGGTANFDHAIIRYGGQNSWGIFTNSSNISNNGGVLNISRSEISHGNTGVYHGAGMTNVSQSSIHDNATGMWNAAADTQNAQNNWWGSATGPTHPSNPGGTGDSVSDRIDFTPWLGYDPTVATSSPIGGLSNPTETEDDGNQDAKGVADKTKFTFGILYTGAIAPSDVMLWTNDGATTKSYPLTQGSPVYSMTSTFPKGHYGYHFEANGGAQRFPASGELGFTTGYSNVAFLPGMEASRLYTQGTFLENQLWFPNTQEDVRKLALSPTTGESIDPNVYTRDVIDEVAGTVNIYKTFLASLKGMVTSGSIEEADIFPYDWRKDQKDVATQLVLTGPNGEFYSMVQRIEDMASSSPTGKATLVTHSNGGLVAKELVEILRQRGKANMIDRIIMVAAPQLGTPKAILETLHGSDFVLDHPNPEVTRELAENMKSAYTLLPSRDYFNRLGAPIRPLVEFSTTTLATQNFRNLYGNSISDYDTLRRFLRGDNGARTEPAPDDVNTPNVLKENFFANAETRHAFEDSWTPPAGIEVIQIIGWGIDTPRGVKYVGRPNPPCVGFTNCTPKDLIDPQPLTTIEGDGTVVYPSAEAMGGEKYFIDLGQHNAWWQFNINRDHKNILEVEPLQDLVIALIKNEVTSTLPRYITSMKPIITNANQRLRIGVHSPVTLHLYDSLGRHTGPISNPDLASDFEINEEQIPNSYYWQIGEGQYAGADGATTTAIELKGKDTGTFTLDIENIIGDITATTTVYEDIPVTASTTAIIQVSGTTTTPLLLDIDGDGKTDASITAGGLTAEDLTGILKGLVKTLHLPAEKEKKLIKKIEKLEKELQKENKNERTEKRKTARAFEEIIKTIKKYEKKGILTHDEAVELISVVEQIKNSVVK